MKWMFSWFCCAHGSVTRSMIAFRVFLSNSGNFLFFLFFMCFIQHCFICRPSDSAVSEDAGIEPRTVLTMPLAVRRSNHSTWSHPLLNTILLHAAAYIQMFSTVQYLIEHFNLLRNYRGIKSGKWDQDGIRFRYSEPVGDKTTRKNEDKTRGQR